MLMVLILGVLTANKQTACLPKQEEIARLQEVGGMDWCDVGPVELARRFPNELSAQDRSTVDEQTHVLVSQRGGSNECGASFLFVASEGKSCHRVLRLQTVGVSRRVSGFQNAAQMAEEIARAAGAPTDAPPSGMSVADGVDERRVRLRLDRRWSTTSPNVTNSLVVNVIGSSGDEYDVELMWTREPAGGSAASSSRPSPH